MSAITAEVQYTTTKRVGERQKPLAAISVSVSTSILDGPTALERAKHTHL